jgi:hypothetical protein
MPVKEENKAEECKAEPHNDVVPSSKISSSKTTQLKAAPPGALLREDTNSNAIAPPKLSFGKRGHAVFPKPPQTSMQQELRR